MYNSSSKIYVIRRLNTHCYLRKSSLCKIYIVISFSGDKILNYLITLSFQKTHSKQGAVKKNTEK